MLTTTKIKSGTAYELNGKPVWLDQHYTGGKTVTIRYKAEKWPVGKTDVVNFSELKEVFKGRTGIAIKPETKERKAQRGDMTAFFRSIEHLIPFHCQNCSKPLYAYSAFARRSSCAHILPKAEFESVATNPDNIMFLGWGIIGVCFCHDDWDRKGREHRSKMKCYDLAIAQFEKFKHELTPHELERANYYLNIKP